MDAIGNRVDLGALDLVLDTVGKQRIAGDILHVHNAFLVVAACHDELCAFRQHGIEERPVVCIEVIRLDNIALVADDEDWLAGK